MSATRVVVTGLGTTSPVGGDVPSTWAALLAGQSGVRPLTEEWAEQLPVKIAARVAVEPTEVLERVKARRLDRTAQLALVAAMEAWADCGLDQGGVDPERLGVAMATGIGGVQTLLDQHAILEEKGPRRVSPLSVPMLMPNASAANISLYVGARAAVNTPVSACASGNEGIALAIDQIRLGRADVVLAGGTEAAIHPLPMAAFAQMMALSKNDGDPTTVSRPWDTGRDGFVHPTEVRATATRAVVQLIVRDFDDARLDEHVALVRRLAEEVVAAEPRARLEVEVREQYRNMRAHLDAVPEVTEAAAEAIRREGIAPVRTQIRGGTDGSILSARGLPTPNLFTGGHEYHSVREWASLQEMAAAAAVVVHLAGVWAEAGGAERR